MFSRFLLIQIVLMLMLPALVGHGESHNRTAAAAKLPDDIFPAI